MATSPESRGTSVPVHNWGWFLLRGLLALCLGIYAIAFPLTAVFAFTLVFAAYVFVDGIASLVSGIPGSREAEGWGALMVRGILGILAGIFFLLMPFVATVAYAFLLMVTLAGWSIIAGALEIWTAVRLRKEIEGEWLLALSGIIALLLGFGILFLVIPDPAATIQSSAWLIAIFAFASGLALVAQALRLKRSAST